MGRHCGWTVGSWRGLIVAAALLNVMLLRPLVELSLARTGTSELTQHAAAPGHASTASVEREAEAARKRDIERWGTEVGVKEKELAEATQQFAERYLSRGTAGGSEEELSGEGLQEDREVTERVDMEEEVPYEEAEAHQEDEEGDVEDEGGSSGAGRVEAEADMPLFLTSVNHARLRRVSKLKRLSLLPSSQPALAFRRCALVGNSGGLLTAPHGNTIDAHDAIMRVNQAPVGLPYAAHAGFRSSFRLLNKKWVTVYSDKVQGQEGLLRLVEANSTLILTRASGWQLDRLLAVVHRLRPDLQVLVLSDPIITQARKMLQAFRLAVNRTFGEVEYGTGASVSLYGFGSPYTSWEWRRRQRGPEEGLLVTQRSAVTAWAGAACQAQLSSGTRGIENTMIGSGGYGIIRGYPLPYHYFVRWYDSYKLFPHPSHNFDLESDFLYALHWATPARISYCPPLDVCLDVTDEDAPCRQLESDAHTSNTTSGGRADPGYAWYQALKPPIELHHQSKNQRVRAAKQRAERSAARHAAQNQTEAVREEQHESSAEM